MLSNATIKKELSTITILAPAGREEMIEAEYYCPAWDGEGVNDGADLFSIWELSEEAYASLH